MPEHGPPLGHLRGRAKQELRSSWTDLVSTQLGTPYPAWHPIWSSLQVDLHMLCQGPAQQQYMRTVLLALDL